MSKESQIKTLDLFDYRRYRLTVDGLIIKTYPPTRHRKELVIIYDLFKRSALEYFCTLEGKSIAWQKSQERTAILKQAKIKRYTKDGDYIQSDGRVIAIIDGLPFTDSTLNWR